MIRLSLQGNIFASLLVIISSLSVSAQTINTYVGTGPTGFMSGSYGGDGGAATAANINNPAQVAFDKYNNMYIADNDNHRIRKVDNAGIISTFAGTGVGGFGGDGGPATSAQFYWPSSLVFDTSGNLIVADAGNNRIRKIDTFGIITTIAGNSVFGGYSGDGGPATAAAFDFTNSISLDRWGNLYVSDWNNYRIRKITPGGIVTTIAGNGTPTYTADGIAATAEGIVASRILVDTSGNVFFCDGNNNRIRKIDKTGIITTFAGKGTPGFSGDGGPATAAEFRGPSCMVYGPVGDIVVADENNNRVRRIDTNGIITTIAGSSFGFSGDGGPALLAEFRYCASVCFDLKGDMFITDIDNNRIRKVQYSKPLSQKSIAPNLRIAIYPNPVSTELYIDNVNEETRFHIIDGKGAWVKEGILTSTCTGMSVAELANGVYYLFLKNMHGEQYALKFIK